MPDPFASRVFLRPGPSLDGGLCELRLLADLCGLLADLCGLLADLCGPGGDPCVSGGDLCVSGGDCLFQIEYALLRIQPG